MADIYYMSGNIKDNINGKLFIIRNDLEFSKIVKPSDNNLCIFKSDKESFFCHILKDKTTDQFDIPLAITDTTEQDVKEDVKEDVKQSVKQGVIGVPYNGLSNQFDTNLQKSEPPSIAISSDNTSTNTPIGALDSFYKNESNLETSNNTPLPQSIQDILRRYNEVFIGQYNTDLDVFNKDNAKIDNLHSELKRNLNEDIPIPPKSLERLRNNIITFRNKYKNSNYKDFIKELLESTEFNGNIEKLIPYFESFQGNDKISNIFDYLIIKFYYFIYDAKKKINYYPTIGTIDTNLYEIRNIIYNTQNYLNDFILYYIFEDVIKADNTGYPTITQYITQYRHTNGVFNIIRERLKNPTIFNFLRKYFIAHSSVQYPCKNPYFSNIIFLLTTKYTSGFENEYDDNAISFILSIIDFITISLFDPNHCKIHKRYYNHPIGTAMFYNILISNIDSLAVDVYNEYFSSPEHNNISTSFTSDKLSLNNYNTPGDIFKNNYNYNNETDKILLAYLISYFKHINENGNITLRSIINNHYLQWSTEYLDNFKLYILYINSIMKLDSRYLKNIRGLCDITTCIKDDIKDIDTFVTFVTTEHKYIDYIDKLSSNIIDKEENYNFLKSYLEKIYNPANLPDYLVNKDINVLLNSLSKVNNTKIIQTDTMNKLKNRRIVMVFILDHIYNKNLGFNNTNNSQILISFGGGGTLNFIRDVDNVKIILNKIEDRDVISTIYSHEIKNDKPLIEFYNLLTPNNIKNVRQFSANQTQSSTVGGKKINKKNKRAKKNASASNIKGGILNSVLALQQISGQMPLNGQIIQGQLPLNGQQIYGQLPFNGQIIQGQLPLNGQPISGQPIQGQIITEPTSSTNSSTVKELGNNKVEMEGKIYNKVETPDSIVYVPDDSSQNSSQISFPSQTSNFGSEFYSEDKIFEYVWNYSNDKLIRFNGYFNMIYDSSTEDIFGNKDKNINRNINIKFFKYFIEKSDYIKRVMNEQVNYNQDENNDVTVISINTLDNQIKHVIYVYSKENFAKFFANNSNLNNKIIAKIYNTPNGGEIYILFDILVDIFKDYISEHLEEQKNRDSFTSLNRYLKFVIDYYKLIDKLDYFTYYVELENWLYHIKSISDSGTPTEIIEAYKNELKTRIVICNAIISKTDNDNINNIKKYLELLQYTYDNIENIKDKGEYANRIKSSCEKQINRIRYYGKNFIFD